MALLKGRGNYLCLRAVSEFFAAGFGTMPGYEERPGQMDMSGAIVRAFNEREHQMIEAGTGVGK